MKKYILGLLGSLALTASVLAHGGVELGPKGGRLVEFSKDETTHGEITVKDGKFHIAILDKDKKPMKVDQQTLTATTDKSEKLTAEKTADGFIVPLVKDGQWLILQFKETPKGKAVTARVQYDTETCSKCKEPEWLCKCSAAEEKKK